MKTKILLGGIILLSLLSYMNAIGQVTELDNSYSGGSPYLGWDATSGVDLEISNKDNYDIFFTANGSEWMRLIAAGNLGIGTNAPAFLLDVNGDVNISSGQIYRIGGDHMLSNIGTRNSFVGVGALSSGVSGIDNVSVGYNAGTTLTSGNRNVSVGSRAGTSITTGTDNVSIGYFAGSDNTTGSSNTFVGSQAGLSSDGVDNNTYIGWRSGYTHISGVNVAAIGARSAESNDGNGTIAVGFRAGQFAEGARNFYIGYQAGPQADGSSYQNTGAIGAYAIATQDSSIVIGGVKGINGASYGVNVGIGTTAPANRFELVKGTAGQSGLRLTSLAGATPGAPNGKVLSIDGNGDVVLVNDSGLIGYCPSIPSLVDDAGVDLDSNNFYFVTPDSLNSTNINRVGIGVGCGVNLNARLDVRDNGTGDTLPFPLLAPGNIAINAISAGMTGDDIDRAGLTSIAVGYGDEAVGVFGLSHGGAIQNVGVKSEAGEGTINYGGYFRSSSSGTTNYGVYANANVSSATTNYGLDALAEGSATDCYGVKGVATCTATTNYGVYGEASGATTNHAVYVNGSGGYTGSWSNLSDRKVKREIADIKNGLEIIMNIKPREYFYEQDKFPSIFMPDGKSFGVIAQELELVLPELVSESVHPAKLDDEGNVLFEEIQYKGVNYIGLIPFTIQAIKEQQAIIEEKEERISKLESEMEALKTQVAQLVETGGVITNEENSTATATELNAQVRDLPVLSQNAPNPFTENTSIRFYLPKGSNTGSIKVFDQNGAIVRMFSLKGEGTGSIEIEGGSMAAGNYYYSLVVDGYQVDSKTLVLTK